MAYLSKDTLLKVYRVLSENTETPDTQGSTQKISAVRHLFALARYVKVKNQSECNLRDRTNKDTFVDYVGDIVKLDDGLYTTNFYTGIKDLPDCGVSSNFFSAGAVAKSKVNPQVSIQYPANNTLFNVHNESLVPIRWSQIPLSFYITSAKCRLAFALWLVRKASIDESNILGSLKSILYRTYPNELIDLLLSPSNKISDALINELPCSFSPTIAQLNKEDIKSIFGDWEAAVDNSTDQNASTPEEMKQMFKFYLDKCCKTSHRTDQNPLYLSGNASSSYMSFLEADKLFDYNPGKWAHITSMYNIADSTKAEEIFSQLLADPAFVERDKDNNQNWRSGALAYYVCFLNALNQFSKVVTKSETPAEPKKPAKTTIIGPLRKSFLKEGIHGFVWKVLEFFHGLDGAEELLSNNFLRVPDKFAWMGACPVGHVEEAPITGHKCLTLSNGVILSDDCSSTAIQFEKFVAEFNTFFAGRYEIEVTQNDQGDEVYYLYRLGTASVLETVLLQSEDASTFVWGCLKNLASNNHLDILLNSDYVERNSGSWNSYLLVNGCFAAHEGDEFNEEAVDGLESSQYITLSDGTYIYDQFEAREIDQFADAINDIFCGQYHVEVVSDNGVTSYRLVLTHFAQPKYLPYLTALRTKPFMLLAGISGTGKSRIVREMAKACWKPGDAEYGKNHPCNYRMVQVKPNWHDSSELIGYVSRINGERFIVGPFLRFMAEAIMNPNVPYFLCLDEMNLAPVEQYFAEYLSVIESRKLNEDGTITTDALIPYETTEAYNSLVDQLFGQTEFESALKNGEMVLSIPQNLFVVGTVNMDETTYSFSRKVLDRAMTLEMNEVDLYGGLDDNCKKEFEYISKPIIVPDAVEGKDVYSTNRTLCDEILSYLKKVNDKLEGTAFKIAYRTRNEFIVYAVNRKRLAPDVATWKIMDEMTSMKILSRIEGEKSKCKSALEGIREELMQIITDEAAQKESISLGKIKNMLEKADYVSYWD